MDQNNRDPAMIFLPAPQIIGVSREGCSFFFAIKKNKPLKTNENIAVIVRAIFVVSHKSITHASGTFQRLRSIIKMKP
jgi:hypothetical protein